MALTCECHWPFVLLIQNGGLIYANYADLSRWGDTAMHEGWAGTREAILQPMELNEGHRLPKWQNNTTTTEIKVMITVVKYRPTVLTMMFL